MSKQINDRVNEWVTKINILDHLSCAEIHKIKKLL